MRQHPAAEELAELGRHERRQPDAVGAGGDGGEESVRWVRTTP